MRRLLPWALLGLLGAGVVVGAAVGALGAPATTATATATATTASTSSAAEAWVAGVFATTADAGTAHFEYSHVTTSANPLLHQVIAGSGVVDFTSGDVQVTETISARSLNSGSGSSKGAIVRSTGQVIGIGRTAYQAVGQEGTPDALWMKLTKPRDPHAELGLQTALNTSVPLDVLGGSQHVVARRSLGHAVVSGLATWRWAVRTVLACPSPLTGPSYETQEPTILWVDSHGRLVQVTTVVHTSGKLTAAVLKSNPALARAARGAATTTDTLRFYDFGAPVHIAAPTRVVTIPFRSTGTVEARCSSG